MTREASESVVERRSGTGMVAREAGKGSQGSKTGREGASSGRWRWIGAAVGIGGLFAALFVLFEAPAPPIILWNASPSMDTGFYARKSWQPERGSVVFFEIPEAARLYAKQRGLPVGWAGFLKPVAAVAGDEVCVSLDEGLRINGERLAEVERKDSAGVVVAAWPHCRKLLEDEFFLYAPRVPNSYDSRYYGPVRGATIKGVYEPLWTW